MAVLEVLRMGHPVLRQAARKVEPGEMLGAEIQGLIQNMLETMVAHGGIGIAAPQVGASLQLAIIDLKNSDPAFAKHYGAPMEVFFNPEIEVLDAAPQAYWEGCLSVPGLRGEVERPRKIRVKFYDSEAKPQELIAEDFMATVFQHEFDHLYGTLYIDRIKDTKKLSYLEEFSRYWAMGDTKEV
ncbi:MAG: peptide deformylase [Acidobacteria bacterium]|nr:peptide deformylase [Acidobacteriota bacterium]